MRSSRNLIAAIALAAVGAGLALSVNPVVPKSTHQVAARRYDAKRSLFVGGLGGGSYGRRARRGWSNRKVQRMAAKRRNQARHRARCR